MNEQLLEFAKTVLDHMTSDNYMTADDIADICYDAATRLRLVEWNGDQLTNLSAEKEL